MQMLYSMNKLKSRKPQGKIFLRIYFYKSHISGLYFSNLT